MRRKLLLAIAFSGLAAHAQDPADAVKAPTLGSISGRVVTAGAGTPIPDVEVAVNRGGPKAAHAVTDSQGHFALTGLEAGTYRVSANAPDASGRVGFGPNGQRTVVLQPGQNLEAFDFRLVVFGTISGKVLDQNKEPVPGVTLFLAVQEYVSGVPRVVYTNASGTDDQGEYEMGRVQPGRRYLLLAKRLNRQLPAISDAPADAAFRRPAFFPTYYPNSKSVDGAEVLVIAEGERREGVDIRMIRGASYCLEGIVDGAPGLGAPSFRIAETVPTSGTSGNGAMYTADPGGKTAPDGKIRVCDLHTGEYELTAYQASGGRDGGLQFFGSSVITIGDRDVQNVRISSRPRVQVAGEVAVDGPALDKPVEGKITGDFQALSRTERGTFTAEIPGSFALKDGLFTDDFSLSFRAVPSGFYVKDVTYSGRSILYEPMRLGATMADGGLRVVLARNGGTASVKVADKDGNAISDCSVLLLPASASNEGMLSAAMVTGRTNTQGTWKSASVAPGKYYVIATNDQVNKSIVTMAKIWALRTGAQEVEISPSGNVSITLSPRGLD